MEDGVRADDGSGQQAPVGPAMNAANKSYEWYERKAIHSRRLYKIHEVVVLVASAAIPTSAALYPRATWLPAALGGVVTILIGLRTIFHWQENYIRFSYAREAIEANRRLYTVQADDYADLAKRDAVLMKAVTAVENAEMSSWMRIASPKSDTTPQGPSTRRER